ncbi:hypothetical protein IWX75_002051 [Arthrobacter sp. CAN_A6]|uniref:hypothetical protein n=1 Tax=Arthrobacter sp. CAN_A6 TaxID=2787721 RepID=UPI0018CA62F5
MLAIGGALLIAFLPGTGEAASDGKDSARESSSSLVEQIPDVPGADKVLPPTAVPISSEDAPESAPYTGPETAAPPTVEEVGSGMGGDLPPELLPSPAYPSCPVTDLGNWWTDPADPYTCLPPESRGFSEPVPPVGPGDWTPWDPAPVQPGEDCRVDGVQRCEVLIEGQTYVVTFSEGAPLHVYAAPAE